MFFSKSSEQVCSLSKRRFVISAEEVSLYNSFDIPLPTLHPEERLRRQLAFRNGRHFFERACEKTGRAIRSVFQKNSSFPVVDNEFWWSKDFDAIEFAREFDTKRAFFEQLFELWQAVPRPATVAVDFQNSEAIHHAKTVKDSFYLFDAHRVRDCIYCVNIYDSDHCVDCYNVSNSSYCYECLDCHNSKNLSWSEHCGGCENSRFLANCKDCKDCLFCTNLTRKSYCIFNKQYSKDDYLSELEKYNFVLRQDLEVAKNIFSSFLQEHCVPHIYADNPQSVSGNYLKNCTQTQYSYECFQSANLYACNSIIQGSRCIDGYGFASKISDSAQFVSSGANAKRILNSIECWNDVSDLTYSSYCHKSSNLFACVGLKDKEYCIFNQQYSKKEYHKRVTQIISYLKKKNIWGQYFPSIFSGFNYQDSLANEFMHLSAVQVTMMGYVNSPLVDEDMSRILKNRYISIPSSLVELSKLKTEEQSFLCEFGAVPFKFEKKEIEMYQLLNVPPPARAFQQRHLERVQRLSPKRIFNLPCYKTRQLMQTAFPDKWKQPVVQRKEWLELVKSNSA